MEGNRGDGRLATSANSLRELRWRTFLTVFGISSLGMIPLILTGRDYRFETIGALVFLSIGFALLAVIQGLLRRVSHTLEALGLLLGAGLYLQRYAYVLSGVADASLPPEALADVFPWVSVLAVAIFLVLPIRPALLASSALLAFVAIYGFVILPHRGPVRGLEPMFDLSISGAVLILLLAVFRRTVEAGTRAEARAEALAELATRDALTGLHNRRYLDEKLAEEFARARRYRHPLTVAICDIDDFKRINDRFSHALGDQTLRRLARLIRGELRENDVVARYGGEEFVILFPETSKGEAAKACQKLCEAVAAFDWGALQPGLGVTLSIGLADDLSLVDHEKLLHLADTRLYEAKFGGKNRVAS